MYHILGQLLVDPPLASGVGIVVLLAGADVYKTGRRSPGAWQKKGPPSQWPRAPLFVAPQPKMFRNPGKEVDWSAASQRRGAFAVF